MCFENIQHVRPFTNITAKNTIQSSKMTESFADVSCSLSIALFSLSTFLKNCAIFRLQGAPPLTLTFVFAETLPRSALDLLVGVTAPFGLLLAVVIGLLLLSILRQGQGCDNFSLLTD
jgi:hypothetical protein